MDDLAQPTDRFDLGAAPLRIGRVRLRVRDLERMARFYEKVMGLDRLEAGGDVVSLGVGGEPLLELKGDPALAPLDRREAGLFHTAFLLPDRAALARWLAHARGAGIRLEGASDHRVSEALYLSDPEGNGIEVYADRPPAEWGRVDGRVEMPSDPLDLDALLAEAEGTRWTGMPADGTVGHVHLQVGDTDAAERFYRDLIGFDLTHRYRGGSFFGAGGYHHQLAANVWNSRGAGRRREDTAGLEEVELVVRDEGERQAILARARDAGVAVEAEGSSARLHDPWGTAVMLTGAG